MLTLLKQAEQLGALRAFDYHFAALIAPLGPMALAAALLSLESHAGHVCLSLARLTDPTVWFEGRFPQLAQSLWQQAAQPSNADWLLIVQACDAVGVATDSQTITPTPIILDHQCLYLQRFWYDEIRVAAFLRQTHLPMTVNAPRLKRILKQLFISSQKAVTVDWQKVAVAVAATRKTALIIGGPGTGKTTTVARLLATLLLLFNYERTGETLHQRQRLRIQLAAPTGKAALRLTQALMLANETLPLTASIRAQLPTEAITLHRLLGAPPSTQYGDGRWRYHAEHHLPLDVLVIDESSMIDLPLMARLVAALPQQARLILLGDCDQLAAVEAGAVLGNLVKSSGEGYSVARAAELTRLTGYHISATKSMTTSLLSDSQCHLSVRYRFQAGSAIDQLAQLINNGDDDALLAYLQQPIQNLKWCPVDHLHYQDLLQTCISEYRDYLQRIRSQESAEQVLAAFSRFQLLCALREGPFGVTGLNANIEQALQRELLITIDHDSAWYSGRPIIITRNHYALALFNGDIGITMPDAYGHLRVYFASATGAVKAILPSRMPPHHTTYALTIHKAQGSEFNHTLLLLPPTWSPLLTRELLYTAISRAKKQLTLYADVAILRTTIKNLNQRYCGLARRLNGSSQ